MKIGNECINNFKSITGINENISPSGTGRNVPVIIGYCFKCAYRGGSDGNNSFTGRLLFVDNIRRFRTDTIKLGVHVMFFHIIGRNRPESTEPHMQC